MASQALAHEQRMARECPDMPDDFWPEIVLTVKHKDRELGLEVTAENVDDLRKHIETLRSAAWQSTEWKL